MMIRPVAFRMNEQTAVNNYYQKVLDNLTPQSVNAKAQEEFDTFVQKLKMIGLNVVVVEDTLSPDTPDSIFPNNWISFHENGDVVLYPMFAENRRLERREDILDTLEEKGFVINEIMDYTSAEEDNVFLEGTGSIVLDRANGKAYCALSPRADEELFIEFCEDFEFTPVIFEAFQTVNGERKHIYHTNVIMCVGETFAVICADCIDDKKERKMVLDNLKDDKKEIILSTYLRIEGYKPVDNGGVYIKATLYPFEAKQPVSETTQEKYYDSASKTYKTRSVTTVTISAKYPIALEVVDKLNNTVLLNTVIGGEYVGFINSSNPVIEKDLLDKNLKAVKALLDNNYGFATVTRKTILYTIKPKKFEYPEYQTAFEKAMSFYNTLKYTDQDLSANLKEAITLWEQAITEYVPNDSKARIDEDVVSATYYNLAEAYLWLNDFDKANQYLTKLFAFKLKDSEKAGIDSFKDFINDQKERYLANK